MSEILAEKIGAAFKVLSAETDRMVRASALSMNRWALGFHRPVETGVESPPVVCAWCRRKGVPADWPCDEWTRIDAERERLEWS